MFFLHVTNLCKYRRYNSRLAKKSHREYRHALQNPWWLPGLHARLPVPIPHLRSCFHYHLQHSVVKLVKRRMYTYVNISLAALLNRLKGLFCILKFDFISKCIIISQNFLIISKVINMLNTKNNFNILHFQASFWIWKLQIRV